VFVCWPSLLCFSPHSPGFRFVFSVLAKRLAGKSISKMAYFVSSGALNFNSVNQSVYACNVCGCQFAIWVLVLI